MTALALVLAFAPVPKGADPELVKQYGTPVDAGKDCTFKLVKDGLTVSMPAAHHTLTAEGGTMNAPRTERDAAGDFTASVRVKSALPGGETSDIKTVDPGVGGGLVLWIDEKNYAALIRVHERRSGGPATMHELHFVVGGVESDESGTDVATSDGWHSLRLTRKGGKITAESSADGKAWVVVKEAAFPAKPAKLGVFAEHNTSKPVTVSFSEFTVK